MKTGYTTYWTTQNGADMKALKAKHERCFPGNELAVVNGYVKVAVLDGEKPPIGATTIAPKMSELTIAGNVSK